MHPSGMRLRHQSAIDVVAFLGMQNINISIAGISKRFHFASLHYIFSAYLPTHIKFLTEFHRIFFGTTCISFLKFITDSQMDALHLFFLWQRQWGAVNHHFTHRTICVHVAPCVAQPYLPRIHIQRQRGFEVIEARFCSVVFGMIHIFHHPCAGCTWHHRVFHIRIGRHRQCDAAVFLYAEAHRTVGVAPQRRALQLERASQPHGIVQILRFVKHAIVGERIVGVAKSPATQRLTPAPTYSIGR